MTYCFSYHDDCITKDCVLWAAKDFNDVTRIMKLDLHEPPMSQVYSLIPYAPIQHHYYYYTS